MNSQETELNRSRLKAGAWYSIRYAGRMDVCVIAVRGELIKWECPQWLYSAAQWERADSFFGYETDARFIGYGKKRTIGAWLRRKLDCVGTIYTKPHYD